MTNLFDFLKNHKDQANSYSYGDILENKSMTQNLSQLEQTIYAQFKYCDKQRLINSGRLT